jgi:hypothetical protein
MFVYSVIEAIRKETEAIKSAPISYFIVCLVLGSLMWTGFHLVYKGKLDAARDDTTHWHDQADRWKGDVDYWKDMANRTVYEKQDSLLPQNGTTQTTTAALPNSTSKPSQTTSKESTLTSPASTPTSVTQQTVVASNGSIAIGGNNSGNNSVTNIGSIPRSLTATQIQIIRNRLGSPPENFDGVGCIFGDEESCRFADQIRAILQAAGWPKSSPQDWSQQTMHGIPSLPSGILIEVSPDDAMSPPDGVLRLFEAFEKAGIEVNGVRAQNLPRGHFDITISSNPH